jgi:hypothetical protein
MIQPNQNSIERKRVVPLEPCMWLFNNVNHVLMTQIVVAHGGAC